MHLINSLSKTIVMEPLSSKNTSLLVYVCTYCNYSSSLHALLELRVISIKNIAKGETFTGLNFHWAKLSRYPQHMDFHSNTFAVQG